MSNVKSGPLNRRRFLKSLAIGTTATLSVPLVLPGKALGLDGVVAPSEKILLGAIGVQHRGVTDLKCFFEVPDIQFVAICDIQKKQRLAIKELGDQQNGDHSVAMYRDMNEMLERPDIDAVLIATGDRWHTMASIAAAKHGKDVYCEKPLAMTISESRRLADAVERYGIVYQAGTQRRNVGNFMLAAHLAQSGKLGKLKEVHAHTQWPAADERWFPAQPTPDRDEVDWDLWLGPCPWRPYNAEYVRGNWRNIWDFHGGGILEWGSHTIDLCQWGASKDHTAPVKFEPQFNEDGSKSGKVFAWYDDGLKLVMRSEGWLGLGSCAARYVGEDGWVETGDSGRIAVSSDALRRDLRRFPDFTEGSWRPLNHVFEFCRCIKTRETPKANAQVAAETHIVAHCAFVAWQLGRTLHFDPVKEEFLNDDEANRMRSRAQREPYTY